MKSRRTKRLLIIIIACSASVCCGLSFAYFRSPRSVLKPEPITNEANHPGAEPIIVTAKHDRSDAASKSIRLPKPSAVLFRGECAYGKQCVRLQGGGTALCRTNYFKVIEVLRASPSVRERLKNSFLDVRAFTHPRSAPAEMQEGVTYTLRWTPSDETWREIGEESFIFVRGDELEVIGSIPD